MPRNRNTTLKGQAFADTTVGAVWKKGKPINGYDADLWRHDSFGNVMKFPEYGNISSKHGWEVDHIKPVAKGGSDDISNLQPLQWEQNRTKGDDYP